MGQDDLPIRSYSQLSQLEDCGEAYRLKRIVRLPETPAVWFPAGNAFHDVTEKRDRFALDFGELEASNVDWGAEFQDSFVGHIDDLVYKGADPDTSTWRTAGRTKEDVAWWVEHGPEMVRDYARWRINTSDRYEIWVAGDGTPGIEWEGTAVLGGVNVTMRADRIFVDKGTGATIIVDLKSGSYEPDNPLQLRVYHLVAERAAGVPMWYGAYFMARKGELTKPIPLDDTNEAALAERYRRAEALIQAGIFLPRPSPKNCRQCGFKSQCFFAED